MSYVFVLIVLIYRLIMLSVMYYRNTIKLLYIPTRYVFVFSLSSVHDPFSLWDVIHFHIYI